MGRRGRGRHLDPLRRQPLQDQSTLTWALSDSISMGTKPSSSGAAVSTTFAANRRNHQRQLIHTIVPMASRTGRLVGQYPRRSGAVVFTARAARTQAVDA